MQSIKVGIVGVGNCASSLIQRISHYRRCATSQDGIGLMHWEIGGYAPGDIDVVTAFDIDARKVGHTLHDAIFAQPNCTKVFCKDVDSNGVTVSMGCVLDGFSDHMKDYDQTRTFVLADEPFELPARRL